MTAPPDPPVTGFLRTHRTAMDIELFLIECEEYGWDPVEIIGRNYSGKLGDRDRGRLIELLWALLRRYDHAALPLIRALGDKRYAGTAACALVATEDPALAPLVRERGECLRNPERKRMVDALAESLEKADHRIFWLRLGGVALVVERTGRPWWPPKPRWWPDWWPAYPEAQREDIGTPPTFVKAGPAAKNGE